MSKTKYELQTELKSLLDLTGVRMNMYGLLKTQLEDEIKLQKVIIANRKWDHEKSKPGRLGPRAVRFETNEEGLNVPVGVVERLSKPLERRSGPGRPPKVKPAPSPAPVSVPEAIQTNSSPPALMISDRILTLGDVEEIQTNESKSIMPMLRCTCITCPSHSSKKPF